MGAGITTKISQKKQDKQPEMPARYLLQNSVNLGRPADVLVPVMILIIERVERDWSLMAPSLYERRLVQLSQLKNLKVLEIETSSDSEPCVPACKAQHGRPPRAVSKLDSRRSKCSCHFQT